MRLDYTFKYRGSDLVASCALGDYLITESVLHEQILPQLNKDSTVHWIYILTEIKGFGNHHAKLTLYTNKARKLSLMTLTFDNAILNIDQFTLNLALLEAPFYTKIG